MNEWQNNDWQSSQSPYGRPPEERRAAAPGYPPYSPLAPGSYPQLSQPMPSTLPPAPGVPYQGGIPVRCPRCSNVVNTRCCPFCGLDLSAQYTIQHPAYASGPANAYRPPTAPTAYQTSGLPGGTPSYPSVPGPSYTAEPATPSPMGVPGGYPYGPSVSPEGNRKKTAIIVCSISAAALIAIFVVFLGIRTLVGRTGSRLSDLPGYDYISPSQGDYYHPEGVSLEEYRQLKTGMSYAQVSQIIGGDGQEYETGETPGGDTYYTYAWYGENSQNVFVYITFVDSAATKITNEGLVNE